MLFLLLSCLLSSLDIVKSIHCSLTMYPKGERRNKSKKRPGKAHNLKKKVSEKYLTWTLLKSWPAGKVSQLFLGSPFVRRWNRFDRFRRRSFPEWSFFLWRKRKFWVPFGRDRFRERGRWSRCPTVFRLSNRRSRFSLRILVLATELWEGYLSLLVGNILTMRTWTLNSRAFTWKWCNLALLSS